MTKITNPASDNRANSLYEWLEICVLWLFLVVSWAVLPIILCLLLAGLWEMSMGLLVFVGYFPKPDNALSADGAALQHAIRGIEFFLLSPLAYFVLLSLANYIKNSRAGAVPDSAKERLLGVKALTTGLLIAVVAADLVGKVLSREGLGLTTAFSETLLIVVLGCYFFGLEFLGLKLHEHR